jgi:L-histidine Nalpha-methyltransferase
MNPQTARALEADLSAASAVLQRFAADVRAGLLADPKRLSCEYFYDREGSTLFEQISRLREYYLTRAESQILLAYAREIAQHYPQGVSVAELGSGSAVKTRILLEALLANGSVRYVPIDISGELLAQTAQQLLVDYPGLAVDPVADDYQRGLSYFAQETVGPKLVIWLGSSIGNLDRTSAAEFLRGVRGMLESSDRLLVGIDLRKSPKILERAYDDEHRVTAQFNLNLLARINRELGGQFDLSTFRHRIRYDELEGRIEMYLESQCDQRVPIALLGEEFAFRAGERIHTENSYKYSLGEIERLARAAGLRLAHRWFDRAHLFSLNLFEGVQ